MSRAETFSTAPSNTMQSPMGSTMLPLFPFMEPEKMMDVVSGSVFSSMVLIRQPYAISVRWTSIG